MNKILLILKREYITRVRKRTFVVSTILFPVLYLGLIFGTAYIGAKSRAKMHLAVVDQSGYFDRGRFERSNLQDSSISLTLVNDDTATLRKTYQKQGYQAYIVIPATPDWQHGIKNIPFTSYKSFGAPAMEQLGNKLNGIWIDIKNEKLGIDDSKKNVIRESQLSVKSQNINDNTASGIGLVAGFMIYLILLIYGSQVMMGVMEEKTNRIAEVIISSVKPFQLMLGKIIGIGLVGLTQFCLWVLTVLIVYNVGKASGNSTGMMADIVSKLQDTFTNVNVPFILFAFVFYFLGGFFFYASLYAAIGSSVNEDMREAQSLSFPITLLVIFSIASMGIVLADPTGPVATWGSIIPFSSPIIMMARIPFGVPGTVPYWQLGLSVALLIGSFLFTVWLSGKIYRTGILMYGKKPSWKEMMKWAFRKS